eukprot:7388778-Prymnesium_polylepis.1
MRASTDTVPSTHSRKCGGVGHVGIHPLTEVEVEAPSGRSVHEDARWAAAHRRHSGHEASGLLKCMNAHAEHMNSSSCMQPSTFTRWSLAVSFMQMQQAPSISASDAASSAGSQS